PITIPQKFPASIREALNKPILDFSEHAKQKAWFLLCFIFNGLPPSKMAAHPCAAGTSDLIRGSLASIRLDRRLILTGDLNFRCAQTSG
ncbi:MAG: hypothetical protein ACT4NU_06550, partial [Chromatiales bacterium]